MANGFKSEREIERWGREKVKEEKVSFLEMAEHVIGHKPFGMEELWTM